MATPPNTTNPHFVLFPFMAQGHHIPMTDLAQLLASHGILISLVTTPLNATRLHSTINHALAAGLPIHLVSLPFPASEVGLPDGCENLDVLPSWDFEPKLVQGTTLLLSPFANFLREQAQSSQPPTCLISDAFYPWTREVTHELRIPRLVFHGTSCFSLLCLRSIKESGLFVDVEESSVMKTIPDLAHKVEVSKEQVPGFFIGSDLDTFRMEVAESEQEADGLIVNSFEELEPWYIEQYGKVTGKKIWAIGPLSLYKKGDLSHVVRGNKASIDVNQLDNWLSTKGLGSVVYASFGSLATIKAPQLMEIALGLEILGHPFIWVVRRVDEGTKFEGWLGEFEKRNRGRCFVIKGWAPQAMILSHPSVGCFVTHCGWNSTLEGLASGVPMAMWPQFCEQFLNAKLVVEVLGVGVGMEVREANWSGDGVVLGRVEIKIAMKRIMDGGEEGEERRKRAKEVEEMARKAMTVGGSSYANIIKMIEQMNNHFHSLNGTS